MNRSKAPLSLTEPSRTGPVQTGTSQEEWQEIRGYLARRENISRSASKKGRSGAYRVEDPENAL